MAALGPPWGAPGHSRTHPERLHGLRWATFATTGTCQAPKRNEQKPCTARYNIKKTLTDFTAKTAKRPSDIFPIIYISKLQKRGRLKSPSAGILVTRTTTNRTNLWKVALTSEPHRQLDCCFECCVVCWRARLLTPRAQKCRSHSNIDSHPSINSDFEALGCILE